MRTKPSKPRPWQPTHRQLQPWDDGAWNLPRIQKWARRAPLHAVLTLDKMLDRSIFVLSCTARGYGGRAMNMRYSLGGSGWTPDGLRRALAYTGRKAVQRMQRECGRKFASLTDETGIANVERL